MKKILRLVTTSVLTLTLVACGEASSSVSSSVSSSASSSSSSVATSTSAFANVTSVTLSAASDGLTQVVGAIKPVTVTAALNANTNPSTAVKWFVNGVQQSTTGRTLTFTPSGVGTFNVTAIVGDVLSNVLPVTVANTVNVTSATFDSPARILVVANPGAEVSLTGAVLSNTSRYDLKTGTYIIDLEEAVSQGSNVTVRMQRDGGTPTTRTLTYDTRTVSLDRVVLVFPDVDGSTVEIENLLPTNGTYTIEKPFEGVGNISYTLKVKSSDLVFDGSAPASVKFSTKVPAGATAIPTNEYTTDEAEQEFTVVVSDETVAGVYEHTVQFGPKTLLVRVNITEARKNTLELASLNQVYSQLYEGADDLGEDEDFSDSFNDEISEFDLYDPITDLEENNFLWPFYGQNFVYTHNFGESTNFDEIEEVDLVTILKPDANGFYVVEKPYSSDLNVLNFGFEFFATGFTFNELTGLENVVGLTLSGPSELLGNTQLFEGIEVSASATAAATHNANVVELYSSLLTFGQLNDEVDLEDMIHNVPWLDSDEHLLAGINQTIDRGTPAGDYTFTLTAGPLGSQKTLVVKLRVVEPAPKIELLFNDLVYFDDDNNNEAYDAAEETRLTRLEMVNNVVVIEKPTIANVYQQFSWSVVTRNYQSEEATIEEQIADSLVQNSANRKTFTIASDEFESGEGYTFTVGNADPISINTYTTNLVESDWDLIDDLEEDKYYKFVDLQLSYNGLGKDLEYSIARDRQAVLRSELGYKDDSFIKFIEDNDIDLQNDIYNLTEVGLGLNMVDTVYFDPSLIVLDNNSLVISSSTPTGSMVITARVDGITQTFTIRIVEPQIKMLLVNEDSTNLYAIDDAIGFNDGDLPKPLQLGSYFVSLSQLEDLTYDGSNVLTQEYDNENFITIADLKTGSYNWSVTRKYPNGSTYSATDSITIIANDISEDNILNILGFDGSDLKRQKFHDNFRLFNLALNESELIEVGVHEFTFSFGNLKRTFTIEVLEDPQLIVQWIQIGNNVYYPNEQVANLFAVNSYNLTNVVDLPVWISYSFNESINKLATTDRYFEINEWYFEQSALNIEASDIVLDEFDNTIEFTEFDSKKILLGYLNYDDSEDDDLDDLQNEYGEQLYLEFRFVFSNEVYDFTNFSFNNYNSSFESGTLVEILNQNVIQYRFG